MKITYYDSRLNGKRTKPRKAPVNELLITFSPMSDRIYFSAGATDHFDLEINQITFVQVESGPGAKSLFLFIDKKHGYKVTNYRWNAYVNSKKAVEKILSEYIGNVYEEHIKFKVCEKPELIDGHRMYRLERAPEVTGNNGSGGGREGAERLVREYKASDFKGRIKTQETLSAEREVYRLHL